MSKKLLFIAYYFPPLAASGSLRAAGFSRHFPARGFDTRVVSVHPDSTFPPEALDPSLEAAIPGNVCIDRLEFPTRLRQLLRFRDTLRAPFRADGDGESNSAPAGESTPGDGTGLAAARRRLLDRMFLFPDHQAPWIRAATRHVLDLPPPERPDVILATGNPWSSLVAANRISRRLNIPYVADFRDPWIDNPKPPQDRGLLVSAEMLERRVVTDAARVVANTEELREEFVRRYPDHADKFVTIPNGFIRNELTASEPHTRDKTRRHGMEITYYGSVSTLRNPLELLRGLNEASQASGFEAASITLRFVGNWQSQTQECEALAVALERRGLLVREPAIPHDECVRRMREADCLLILQQAFPLQIPAKIYEYISTGRPILLIGGEGATRRLLEKYRLGLACRNDASAVEALLSDVASGRRAVPTPDWKDVGMFDYESLTREMTSVLNEASSRRPHPGRR